MSVETQIEQRTWALIDKIADRDKQTVESVYDLLTWGFYGHTVLSQFGLGVCGWIFRQRAGTVLTTLKVVEEGVPLVAFATSATTMGCIGQLFDRLWENRITWQKDKYPWI